MEQIKKVFEKNIENNVDLLFFHNKDKNKCEYCNKMLELLKEIANIDKRIVLTVKDIEKNRKEAQLLNIDNAPALILNGEIKYNLYYFGIPIGFEFPALINDIIDVSRGKTNLSDRAKEKVNSIKKEIDIKVFVTPTCPYCSNVVRLAHQFSIENQLIKSSMIEAVEFNDLANKYEVMGVPKVVINDSVSFEGSVSEERFVDYLLKTM
ncbi:MAG: thioredoxin family protein [Candidatus Micrarchaeaceae archaeon]